ncbi:hypothetical protein KPL37_01135 [Clostridium frigoris]|uniref:WxL domain-containing protein n=1 Tax=Clostridium frigoris TaxID=205327 RepID=A0ABS6BN70_9CLOT|nr:hypothetical protein [Clostridium frigoris]MBU3158375.1 hypothetical protein [Clostridium frigoris]
MNLKSLLKTGALCTCLAITSSTFFSVVATSALTRNTPSYNLYVPRVGGNAYSNPAAKVSAESAVNNNTSNGGGKTLYSTIDFGTSNVSGEIKTTTGSRVIIPYNSGQNISGKSYRLMMETSVFEAATIQSQGTWSPDLAPK